MAFANYIAEDGRRILARFKRSRLILSVYEDGRKMDEIVYRRGIDYYSDWEEEVKREIKRCANRKASFDELIGRVNGVFERMIESESKIFFEDPWNDVWR